MTAPLDLAALVASAGDPPYLHNEFAELERETVAALHRRRASYPDLIAAEKLDPKWAAADIAAWDAIRADWAWIESDTGDGGFRAGRETIEARLAAIETALTRWAISHGQRRFDETANHQGHCLIALRHHVLLERAHYPNDTAYPATAHFIASVNHEARRRNPAALAARREGRTGTPPQLRKAA